MINMVISNSCFVCSMLYQPGFSRETETSGYVHIKYPIDIIYLMIYDIQYEIGSRDYGPWEVQRSVVKIQESAEDLGKPMVQFQSKSKSEGWRRPMFQLEDGKREQIFYSAFVLFRLSMNQMKLTQAGEVNLFNSLYLIKY